MTIKKVSDLLSMIEVNDYKLDTHTHWGSFDNDMKEALKFAIEALKKVDKLQTICDKVKSGNPEEIKDLNFAETFVGLLNMVVNEPSVTPKEKTGHWINAKVGKLFPSNDFKCSECGNILDFDGVNCGRGDANYCPNCGCHMIEPQESEG
jgi:hypothetical protein